MLVVGVVEEVVRFSSLPAGLLRSMAKSGHAGGMGEALSVEAATSPVVEEGEGAAAASRS
jgi:hypothetical protein